MGAADQALADLRQGISDWHDAHVGSMASHDAATRIVRAVEQLDASCSLGFPPMEWDPNRPAWSLVNT
jgi:hypothetical protein